MKTHYRLTTSTLCGRKITDNMLSTTKLLHVDCKNCERSLSAKYGGNSSDAHEMPSLEEIATETPFPAPAEIRTAIVAPKSAPASVPFVPADLAAIRALISGDAPILAPVPAPATREAWLIRAVEMLSVRFKENGFAVPPVRISVGWPGGKGKAGMIKTIGQCWHKSAAADGVQQIFISPLLDSPAKILATIMHEMAHAVDEGKSGHKAGFKKIAVAVGLEGKMTATHAGEALNEWFKPVILALGSYDHAKLNPEVPLVKAQTNKHLLIKCSYCEFQARTTRKQMDEYSMPEHCGAQMYEA